MSKLKVISAKELIKIVEKLNYRNDHQTGSHIIMRHLEPPNRRITIPNHKTIAKGTLRGIIRQLGITLDEFNELL